MSDIRIPYGQSKRRRFVSLPLRGYVHKYYFFRKPLTTFYWKRKKFSKRVADFVKDESANGVYVNGQDRVTAWEFRDGHYPHQDCEWCRSDRKNNLDEEKYIFIAY